MFSDRFDVVVLKINLKKQKKIYFDIFSSEKYFRKQPLPQYQLIT